jgi:hypothetical protein
MPQPGDYFTTPTYGRLRDRLAADIIRLDTNSPVNHAGLYIGPTRQHPEGAIIEAVGTVRYNSVNAYPDAIWFNLAAWPATDVPGLTLSQERGQIIDCAEAALGSKYNTLDILAVGIAQKRLTPRNRTKWIADGKPPWWVKRLSSDHRYICSQLVDAAYRSAGIHLFADGRLPGLVTPGDLYTLTRNQT